MDYLGNELKVGDSVVFMRVGYRSLLHGRIAALSNKKCVIKHEENNTNKTETVQFQNQTVKIN